MPFALQFRKGACMKMTSQMTCCYLPVTALLLLSMVPTTVTEVVRSMSDCDQFLLDRTPPHIPGILEDGKILEQNRYKPICQTFMNQRTFVTLYDIKNKIPAFSANRYRGQGERKRPSNNWKIEPQLEKEHYGRNMREDKGKTNNHQAGKSDYRNNGTFNRGHLYPSSYGFNKTDKMSTFTLTNIVPQAATFNQGSWSRMERCIKCVMDKYCINNNGITEGFVVTGAQPSSNNTLHNKINVPSMLWSAFCCYSSTMNMWLASAHWGDNVPDESKKKYLQTRTLAELRNKLRTVSSEFKVFPGTRCPLNTTVIGFYPESKNCQCPSSNSITSTSRPHTSTSGNPRTTFDPLSATSGTPTISSHLFTTESGSKISTSGPPPLAITSGSYSTTSGPLTPTSVSTAISRSPESTSGPATPACSPPAFSSCRLGTTSVSSTSSPPTKGLKTDP